MSHETDDDYLISDYDGFRYPKPPKPSTDPGIFVEYENDVPIYRARGPGDPPYDPRTATGVPYRGARMTAPVSPIAIQETVEGRPMPIALGTTGESFAWLHDLTTDAGTSSDLAEHILTVLEALEAYDQYTDRLAAALSSAERRIEELVRGLASVAEVLDPHWPAKHKPGEAAWMVEEIVALANEATDVTTLKAEVEELKRERDEAQERIGAAILAFPTGEGLRTLDIAAGIRTLRDRLASLTGQVEDMPEAATEEIIAAIQMAAPGDAEQATVSTKVPPIRYRPSRLSDADAVAIYTAIRAAIRSLPVLPTTGEGGESLFTSSTGEQTF